MPSLHLPTAPLRVALRRYLVGLAGLLILMSVVLMVTMEVHQRQVVRLDHNQQIVTSLDDLLLALVDIETGERGFLLTGQEPFLSSYDDGLRTYTAHHAALMQLLAGQATQQAELVALDTAVQRWLAEVIQPAIGLRREVVAGQASMDDVLAFVSSGIGKRHLDGIRAQVGRLRATELQAEAAARGAAAVATVVFRGTVVGSILLILVAVAGSRMLLGRVLERLEQIAAGTRGFAADPHAPLAPLPAGDDAEIIKTQGDAYLVASNVLVPNPDHPAAIADLALSMREAMTTLRAETDLPLEVRIGIHTGPVVAGSVGSRKLSYDIWGDTVNVASRMESHGVVGQIQVSEAVYERLRANYHLTGRGAIPIKGKGELPTYLLHHRTAHT